MNAMTPIYWNGNLVGHVSNLSGEMFDRWGMWHPGTGEPTMNFINELNEDHQLTIELGAQREDVYYTIDIVPESQIEFKVRLRE
jgi:hypothetical protein